MENSPLHTGLLKKKARRVIYSSDEDDLRPEEVPDTPCISSGLRSASGSLMSASEKDEHEEVTPPGSDTPTIIKRAEADGSLVIDFSNPEVDSPWDSDVDGHSDISTPAYKRGRRETETDLEVVRIIQKEGIGSPIPRWARCRGQSIVILADSQVKHWPEKDNICQIHYREGWPLARWGQAIRMGDLKITQHTVLLYLEVTRGWQDVPPIKNGLHHLCKTIRNYANKPQIFVGNHLPRISSSPVRHPVNVSNFTQQQAIQSVARVLGKVYELSLFEHFVSRRGKAIKPWHHYFSEDGNLTTFGCLIFRECILRESGLKPYWFGKRPRNRSWQQSPWQ